MFPGNNELDLNGKPPEMRHKGSGSGETRWHSSVSNSAQHLQNAPLFSFHNSDVPTLL